VSSAQKPHAKSPLESTVYLVRRDAPGVKVSSSFDGLGLRGNDSAPVTIENAAIAEADLISDPGAGAKTMLEVVLPRFALGTPGMAHGLCLTALGATIAHAKGTGFEHNGQKLRDLPNIRARIAQMFLRTEQSRALLRRCLDEMEAGSAVAPLYVLQARLGA